MKKTFSIVLCLLFLFTGTAWSRQKKQKYEVNKLEAEVIERLNDYRHAIGLKRLGTTDKLNKLARDYAMHLLHERGGELSHRGTKKFARSPMRRVKKIGYRPSRVGENLFQHSKNCNFRGGLAACAIDSWDNSPGHRRNMVNRHYNKMGVGVAYHNGDYIMVLVLMKSRR